MQLSSLPDRPLELAELQELNESGRFRAVFPAAVFDLEGTEHKLVPASVLVTEGRVVAAGYDFADGWTRVDAVDAAEADEDLKRQVERAGQALQSWARETEQRWTAPDGADALLERFDA